MAGAKMEMKYDDNKEILIDIEDGGHMYSPIGYSKKSMTFIPVIINTEKVID